MDFRDGFYEDEWDDEEGDISNVVKKNKCNSPL